MFLFFEDWGKQIWKTTTTILTKNPSENFYFPLDVIDVDRFVYSSKGWNNVRDIFLVISKGIQGYKNLTWATSKS